ncbi:MAG: tRNA methyl transferase PRC-barrel domain-containing protein, partial [Actinomycetes bacterium]
DTLKSDVRREALDRDLAVADKPDSHDICFIPDGDTAGFLDRTLGARPGDVVDRTGAKVGEHDGAHRFTVGQRRGLRLGVPADDGQPRYVLDISPVTNTVTVGGHDDLRVAALEGRRPTWTVGPLTEPWAGEVQLRAHAAPVAAEVAVGADGLAVTLAEPVAGVAPGQAAVLYDGSRVVGSATITATRPWSAVAARR